MLLWEHGLNAYFMWTHKLICMFIKQRCPVSLFINYVINLVLQIELLLYWQCIMNNVMDIVTLIDC